MIRDKQIIKEVFFKLMIKDLDLANLKSFKNEVSEIKKGEECGVCFVNFD